MVPEDSISRPTGEVAPQAVGSAAAVQIHSCSRIGLIANPPGFRLPFSDWLRRR